ncbi:MAG: hypothetical protein EHM61_16415 [Acidobacteria bacterium]|nr:MAG: hypothetical protein EHM61_16415 [Acidobacteriota bacterium]
MKYALLLLVFALIPLLCSVRAGDFPQAQISNRAIRAGFYLPDPERGYYRGTRFEWSGVIHSLQFQGHEYFGVWFPRYDPKLHDAITGPVEEFRTGEASVGYAEAKPGETFVRIGVGTLRKPDEKGYRVFGTYEIVDPGKWTVRPASDRIEFQHDLIHPAGYAYTYTKIVRLEPDRPEMVIEHRLKNTGRLPIETSQYNHNFFVIDGQPTGPEARVLFPFEVRATRDLGDKAEVREKQLSYLRELRAGGESVFTELEGFGPTSKDYDFRIENRKAGAGVRITGDRPIAKLVFWSIRTTLCPEPYIDIRVEPGQESSWEIRYEFYTLPAAK